MNEIIPLIFVFVILKIFIEILLPDKKKRKNYRKKQKKITENQKIVIYAILLMIICLFYFPKIAIIGLIILSIIGIFLFLNKINLFKIFKNDELKTPFSQKEYKQKKPYSRYAKKRAGNNYEKEVGKYYESLGYEIIYNGLEKGYYDEGIDLIGKNENRTLLIQCKNWQNSIITIEEIYKFLDNSNKFISKRNFETPIIEKIFVVSNKRKNIEIEEFIERNKNLFEYKEIPYADI